MDNFTVEEMVSLALPGQQPAELIASLKGEKGEWKSKEELKSILPKVFSESIKSIVETQKGRAVRERLATAEKALMPFLEEFGVSKEEQIETTVKKLVETVKARSGTEKIVEKTIELTEDALKNHPLHLKLAKQVVRDATAELTRERDEVKKIHADYVQKLEGKRLDKALYTFVNRELTAAKAILPNDPAKREAQIQGYLLTLKRQHNFKLDEQDENETPFPIDAAGNPLEDNFTTVSMTELVRKTMPFDTHTYPPGYSTPGATTQTPKPAAIRTAQKVEEMSTADFRKAMAALSTDAEKETLSKAYYAFLDGK